MFLINIWFVDNNTTTMRRSNNTTLIHVLPTGLKGTIRSCAAKDHKFELKIGPFKFSKTDFTYFCNDM